MGTSTLMETGSDIVTVKSGAKPASKVFYYGGKVRHVSLTLGAKNLKAGDWINVMIVYDPMAKPSKIIFEPLVIKTDGLYKIEYDAKYIEVGVHNNSKAKTVSCYINWSETYPS